MSLADGLGIAGFVLAVAGLVWNFWVYRKDAPKVSLNACWVPDAKLYVIQVSNSGRRSVTIDAVGINQVFFRDDPRIDGPKLASGEALPHRLEAYDKAYFSVYWDGGVSTEDNENAQHIYVRDARNEHERYGLRLRDVHYVAVDALGITEGQQLSRAQLVQLYDAGVWREDNLDTKRRIAKMDLEIEVRRALIGVQVRVISDSARTERS